MGRVCFVAAAVCLIGCAAAGIAQAREPRSGSPSSSKNIVEDIGGLPDEAILAKAVKAAGLADTLSGPGPFTVFAPTDEAFRKLPDGTVDNLLKAENKAQLQTVLTYHVVPGLLKLRDLVEQVKAGGGRAQLKTVQGETLTVELKGGRSIEILDSKGDIARITTANIAASDGVIHVVSTVLLP